MTREHLQLRDMLTELRSLLSLIGMGGNDLSPNSFIQNTRQFKSIDSQLDWFIIYIFAKYNYIQPLCYMAYIEWLRLNFHLV